jgi:hypothetical protein
MLIAVIAVVHVLVSHYAVGGGLFLAVETGFAYRTGDNIWNSIAGCSTSPSAPGSSTGDR